MKFVIYRTSGYYANVKKLEDLSIDLDKYNVSLESKIDCFGDEKTYAVIEINSLEELVQLTKDYKQIVLNSDTIFEDGMQVIEIYDDWRE